ncbi:MAG: MFS transporter [Clostridiales bacterium]|nr:MFS transporter [Clostridiales bacterium]
MLCMSINAKYRLLQALNCMMFSAGHSYLSYYLLEQGFKTSTIGIIIATAGILSSLAQPYLGRLADRNPNIGWKQILAALAITCEAAILAVIFSPSPMVSAIFYGLEIALINCMVPMVNAACFYYNRMGTPVDFGIARGTGSAAYALTSLALGRITAMEGPHPVPIIGAIVMGITIICINSLPYNPADDKVVFHEKQDSGKKDSIFDFAARYKAFMIMILAILLVFSFQNMYSNYLIQILGDLGGSSADLGKALFIAAVFELPMMLISGKILKRMESHKLIVFGVAAYVIRAMMMYLAGNLNALFFSMTLQMFSFTIVTFSSVHYADVMMRKEDKVTGQALATFASSGASVIGSLTGGFICDAYGTKNMLLAGTALCALALVAALISYNMTEKKARPL